MPENILGRILRLPGYGAYRTAFNEETATATLWIRQVAKQPTYTCNGCGIGMEQVHDSDERRVRDLPWGAWTVWLVLEIHRVCCRRCGVKGTPGGSNSLGALSVNVWFRQRAVELDTRPAPATLLPHVVERQPRRIELKQPDNLD